MHLWLEVGKFFFWLLSLQQVVDGATLDNLYADLTQESITFELITFGVDGVSVFEGVRIGVTFQLKTETTLFMIGVHCMSHCTNLVKHFLKWAL